MTKKLKYNKSDEESSSHIFKCMIIASLQITLIAILTSQTDLDNLQVYLIENSIMRFVCIFLLHVQLQGEISQCLAMFKYMLNHPENFINEKKQSTLFCCYFMVVLQAVAQDSYLSHTLSRKHLRCNQERD